MKGMRRIISGWLAFCLVLSMLPMQVFAVEETAAAETVVVTEGVTEPVLETTTVETSVLETITAETTANTEETILSTEPEKAEDESEMTEEVVEGNEDYIEEFVETVETMVPELASDDSAEVTRAQWIQTIVSVFSMTVEEDNYPDNYYSDLTGAEEYYRDIMVAVEFGVIDLDAGLPFEPEKAATREFAAYTLNFALGFQLGEDTAYTFSEYASVTHPEDIQISINRGWFGLIDGMFYPNRAITMAESTLMVNDAKQVLADDIIDPEYKSDFVFSDEVIVLPENTIVQYNSSTELAIVNPIVAIAQGNIFTISHDGVPIVYRADSVSISGALYTITATQQETMDYLISVDAEGSMSGDLSEFEVAEGLEAIYVLEDESRVRDIKAAGTQKIKRIYVTKKLLDNLTITVEIDNLRLDWYAKGNVLNPSSIDVSAIVYGDLECTASAAFGAAVSNFTDVLELGSFPIGPYGSLGKVYIDADIHLDGSVTAEYGASFSAGVSYSHQNGFRIPKSFQKTKFDITVEATLDYSLSVGAVITGIPFMYANCDSTVGMKINMITKYRELDIPHMCIHTDSWLYATTHAYASIIINVPDIPGFEDIRESWEKTITVWDKNTSPLRSVTHFEDGTRVNQCTHKEDENSFFEGKSSYYSPRESKYANGGVSSVTQSPIYTYTTNENGKATITGYSGIFSSVSIPSIIDGYPVISIGENAFANKKTLTLVTFPEGVLSIASNAFIGCSALRNVSFPNSLTTIGDYAFKDCFNLILVDIPDNVTDIGDAAFMNCTALSKVNLPVNLQTLGNGAFQNCIKLKKILIGKSLTTGYLCGENEYYSGPFCGCSNLDTIDFAEGITTLPDGLFHGASGLTTIALPNTITSLGEKVFKDCDNLTSISLSSSLTKIGPFAFLGCIALENVDLPDSLTHINDGAFENCIALTDVELPDSMVEVGYGVFRNCTNLNRVYIPKNMKTGDLCGENEYYSGPFYGCSNLNTIDFTEGITTLPDGLFHGVSGLATIVLPNTITSLGEKVFKGCDNLTSISLSSSLTKIGPFALLGCIALDSIDLPKSLTHIDDGAFEGCTALTDVKLPDSMVEIGNGAFKNCTNLNRVYIPKNMKTGDLCGENDAYFAGPFYGCSSLNTIDFAEGITFIHQGMFYGITGLIDLTLPSTITSIDMWAFKDCKNLSTLILSEGLTTIGERAFINCLALKELYIPNSVSSIGVYTFEGSGLESIRLPNGRKNIVEGMFYDCKGLKNLNLPDSLIAVREKAFYNCDSLTSINLPENVTIIEASAFYDCDTLETVQMGDMVTSVGAKAFYHCDSLKNVTLSSSLTGIPESAFQQCAVLEEITVPYYVTTIGKNAFNSSPKLTKVILPRNLESIGTTAFSYEDTTVIYGVPGTYAETWANENGFKFVAHEVAATNAVLDDTSLTINKGASQILILTVTPADFTDKITWKSSDTNVVTVTDKGVIKGIAGGTATIKVNVGNVSASCKVTVVQPVTSISLNKTSLTLDAGETYTLTATVRPSDAVNKEIGWTSSDPTVATITADGLVTAIGKGTATITAAAQDGSGITKTCTVTVSNNLYVAEDVSELESVHPYESSCKDVWIYSIEGAKELAVTFDNRTEMEDGFDYLYIYDADGNQIGKYTGAELAGKTIKVPGDTVEIKLDTDDGGTAWGFKVTDAHAVGEEHVHNYGEWTQTRAPTCTENGEKSRVCSCGNTETMEIPAMGHTETSIPGKAATCTGSGLTEGKKCSVCQIVIVAQEIIPAKGHDYQDGNCRICGEKEPGSEESGLSVKRVAGGSRYSTCTAVADELKAILGGGLFDSVVVASGADFPDALAGTYLAAVKKAPILLIADTHIDMMVKYIDKNMADSGTIYILGSENSVSKTAEEALKTVGNVKRLGGKSRFITNLRILEEVNTKTGELLVVYSVAPWDALSVSSSGKPILLVNDKLRDDQKQYLATTSFDKITIIGSTAGVPDTMEAELSAYCSNIDRVYGKNRFVTSIEVAEYFYGTEKGSIVVACGTNFPDGLCSGALAHAKKAPVILTDAGRESLVADYVTGYNIQGGYVIGSAKVVSDDSVRKAFNMTAEDIIK